MNFNSHSNLIGAHAFLGASKYSWINYTTDKLVESYSNALAAQKGTELHDFAATCIKLGQKLPKSQKTLNMYVNDAIGFKMSPEQVLYYSDNCFGTTDAISFRNGLLRIHDLKTGITPLIWNSFIFMQLCSVLNIKLNHLKLTWKLVSTRPMIFWLKILQLKLFFLLWIRLSLLTKLLTELKNRRANQWTRHFMRSLN